MEEIENIGPCEGKLTNPSIIKARLKELGHRPNKGLGQNYLIDGNILDKIIVATDITEGDRVLEIGPGLGALTQALIGSCAPVIAIEKDPTMVLHLKATFPDLNLIESDVLNVNLPELFANGINKIAANLPYSVGSRFIVDVLESNPLPDRMVFMVQKEVADRLVAQPGGKAFGPLAIWSQLHFEVKNIKNVSPNCFMPAPKVSSAVVQFVKRPAPIAEVTDYPRFKNLVKRVFSQRRKQIGSNLRKNMPQFVPGLDVAGIDPQIRPEQIPITQWVALSEAGVDGSGT